MLSWCCENLPLLNNSLSSEHDLDNGICVYYGDLLVNPESVIRKVSNACDIIVNTEMASSLSRKSRSVKNFSSKERVKQIENGSIEKILNDWMKVYTLQDLDRMQNILDVFGVRCYSVSSSSPII